MGVVMFRHEVDGFCMFRSFRVTVYTCWCRVGEQPCRTVWLCWTDLHAALTTYCWGSTKHLNLTMWAACCIVLCRANDPSQAVSEQKLGQKRYHQLNVVGSLLHSSTYDTSTTHSLLDPLHPFAFLNSLWWYHLVATLGNKFGYLSIYIYI